MFGNLFAERRVLVYLKRIAEALEDIADAQRPRVGGATFRGLRRPDRGAPEGEVFSMTDEEAAVAEQQERAAARAAGRDWEDV